MHDHQDDLRDSNRERERAPQPANDHCLRDGWRSQKHKADREALHNSTRPM